MKSAGKKDAANVVELVRMAGNAFAVTHHEDGTEIRRLPPPRPAPEPGQVAKVVVFPWATVRRGR
ncbi:hypothetical protein [Lysobacter capsici]|uniref:hypothetical protein n=1 Tax=Lysobacter capsici TaxID=435897 RepID=UPI001BFFE69C|nr:hypothetical protein [Lysobacter capsici]QWF19275.1 hypothetical protein KME82_11310 [Lysobacter capsici]